MGDLKERLRGLPLDVAMQLTFSPLASISLKGKALEAFNDEKNQTLANDLISHLRSDALGNLSINLQTSQGALNYRSATRWLAQQLGKEITLFHPVAWDRNTNLGYVPLLIKPETSDEELNTFFRTIFLPTHNKMMLEWMDTTDGVLALARTGIKRETLVEQFSPKP